MPDSGFFGDDDRRREAEPDHDVLARLLMGGKKNARKPRKVVANIMTVFESDARWRGAIAYDAFAEAPILMKQPPQRSGDFVEIARGAPWSPQDATRAAAWMLDVYDLEVASGMVTEALLAVSQRELIHPVREYLAALAWDGRPRVDTFFPAYCGTADGPYSRGVARLLFLAAVARVFRPGAKVDTMPILEGPQGAGKSSLLAALAGAKWFADTPLMLGDKDAYQALRGVWIYELAELAAFKGRDATRIKSFASSPTDHYRPSYEPRARSVPRQCVFVGTTNERDYLTDATGTHRFWPITIARADVDAVARDRDQLWAEARVRFEAGEPWWPTRELDALGVDAQEDRFEGDPWEEPIRRWLENPMRIEVDTGHQRHEERLDPAEGITMADVLAHAVHVPVERHDKASQARAAQVMHRAGWHRGPMRREGGERIRRWFPSPASPARDLVTGLVTPGGDA